VITPQTRSKGYTKIVIAALKAKAKAWTFKAKAKAWTFKAKAKAWTFKAKAKAWTFKAKAKAWTFKAKAKGTKYCLEAPRGQGRGHEDITDKHTLLIAY